MLTHRSRGTEIIPAVWLTGSMVNTIMVSLRQGQVLTVGSQFDSKSYPITRIFTRLAPSHGGGSGAWGALVVGIPGPAVDPGTGVPSGVTGDPAQLTGAIPGRAVSRQHVTKPLRKINNPTAATSPTPNQMNCPVVGRFSRRAFFRKSSFLSGISLHGGRNGQVFLGHSDPLISFFDEHHGNVFHDRVLALAILADQPCVFV